MPHKVNPIDFENAEGNLKLANHTFEFLSSKLPISRLQRDLTDSTTVRNIGVGFGYTLISYKSILKALSIITPNVDQISIDLQENWSLLAEPAQTILKANGEPEAYEKLKELTRRSSQLSKSEFKDWVRLESSSDRKVVQQLYNLSPQTYTGIFPPFDVFDVIQ